VQQSRRCFRRWARSVGAGRLIFFDEFGAHLGMTRRYARAPRGQRACGKAPCNTGSNITLVVGLSLQGVVAPLAFEGAMNGDIFTAYMREHVAPTLSPEDVVVVDGLGAHRTRGAREAVEARGARYCILPPYSPDLSPVENCGSKIKEALRAAAARTVQGVYDAMGEAIGRVTSQDAAGWFGHAGHLPRQPRPKRRRRGAQDRRGPRASLPADRMGLRGQTQYQVRS
jgi:transposase